MFIHWLVLLCILIFPILFFLYRRIQNLIFINITDFIQITFFGSSSKRKNMFAVQKIANGAPLALNLYKTQCRTSFLGTPPRVRVSFTVSIIFLKALM